MISVPCRFCEERHVSCHSTCDKYIQYKAKVEEANQMRSKSLEIAYGYRDSILRTSKRSK